MAFDFFVAELTCEVCGETSPADSSTNMQTYIREKASMQPIAAGDRVDVSPENLSRSNYQLLREPEAGTVCIIDTWECPSCGEPMNWAAIRVKDNVIEAIESVPKGTDDIANYASVDAVSVSRSSSP